MEKIARDELKQKIDRREDFALLEVLPADEFNKGHLPGAQNLPLNDNFAAQALDLAGDKERPIVLYCQDAACPESEKAARRLDEAGFPQVYHYQGGKEDWRSAGTPLH